MEGQTVNVGCWLKWQALCVLRKCTFYMCWLQAMNNKQFITSNVMTINNDNNDVLEIPNNGHRDVIITSWGLLKRSFLEQMLLMPTLALNHPLSTTPIFPPPPTTSVFAAKFGQSIFIAQLLPFNIWQMFCVTQMLQLKFYH